MNIKKNFVSHQKSKSINNKLSLKDFDFTNNLLNGQPKIELNNNNNINKTKTFITEEKSKEKLYQNNIQNSIEEKMDEINFVKTIDDMKQSVLNLYYDKNSSFKKKIDNLNLKFYLETEKYLNNNKSNDYYRNQKLQANLFIILFQQINIFIEEIERLNKIILDNKFKKETILQRTNELNEKKQNILIKDNLIQSLKKSNTNTEKKLLETLLHEDKLIKDNERLRKENETYKTLTIVFENELKNTVKKNGLTPQKNKISRHIKTYSDYGVPSTSIINELCGHNMNNNYEEKFETVNNESKFTTRDKKKSTLYNYNNKVANKESYNTNKNNHSINIDKKVKNNNEINKIIRCNKIVKNPNQILTENNSIKVKDKKNVIKFSPNNKLKLKQSQDNKIKIKKDISNSDKIENDNKITTNKNKNSTNLCYSFVYNNNKNILNPTKNKRINIIKKNNNGLKIDSISNNINSTINTNTNTMTETNNLSFEKTKDKNFKKLETKKVCYHKKQKTMSEISFNEIVRVQILNDELNNTISNGNNGGNMNTNNNNNRITIRKNDGKNNGKKSPINKNHYKNNNIKKNF
jgi:hypothetical protein